MTTLPENCELCPRKCGANRAAGEQGYCGADDTLVVARAALHFWEEPPISGEAGSGTVFFSHCPLRCIYCQNAPIAQGIAGTPITEERLVDICLELQNQGALNINFVTPTHYTLQIKEAVQKARMRGLTLPVVWNTSGYETVETVQLLSETVDVYLTDFKYADAHLAGAYSNAPDYPTVALRALDAMVAQLGRPQFDEYQGQQRLVRGVVVRHLLLPGAEQNSRDVLKLLHERYGENILLSIMNQYTSLLASDAQAGSTAAQKALVRFPELSQTVPDQTYEAVLDYADELGIENYFWQEGEANTESFIPPFDLTGVLAPGSANTN